MEGIKFKAYPTRDQKRVLDQWMGCSKVIWNAKCAEEQYYRSFAKKYYPIGTYAPIDASYSQFKSKDLTSFLFECPSVIFRNSASNWYFTYRDFIKGKCGRPRFKKKSSSGSVYLTREVFCFKENKNGTKKLFIGSKKNNIGYLSFKAHRNYNLPNSIYIKREASSYYISFGYERENKSCLISPEMRLKKLKTKSDFYLENNIVAIDRGVKIASQVGDISYNLDSNSQTQLNKQNRKTKALQKKLARQRRVLVKRKEKISKRLERTRIRLSRTYQKIGNIRKDFAHKTSTELVKKTSAKIFILEDLKIKNMTSSARGNIESPGKNVKAKSGLNRAILDKNWYMFENMLNYKSQKFGKTCFKVSASYTSQTCAKCGSIAKESRKSQSKFKCVTCGNTDNADRNASLVIKQRAIELIKHSGTELLGSKSGIRKLSSIGLRAKRSKAKNSPCYPCVEESKKTRKTQLQNTA
ncbi:RNA-guided endonuclease InsQ/TnpB family protein [Rickettsia endosymbiont of Cardiosporidium cionae]|uniref:RNA-guided endonuclease InsQ/TnpB family protein n=1 Tax=Rickettsia endosymbiont of Cardiosporidium cionae TaxID=2777155 RepID=UPI0018945572|nr:RNA-guided endonuclease TnpB family protein [Rickettsia endosymbiont of Cardiosporidium cionae]KAF8818046.1 hypothetical protein IHI24_000911 [Rickettsia endosymbiont of Cardiosporidium cionae]